MEKTCNYYLQTKFFFKKLFAVLSSGLKQTYFFYEKKTYLIDVNWLYISCNVTKKKKSAESSKQDDCYLVLLKVRYGSSHFRIS